jgi:SAM-dependent methyltransferase
VAALLGEKQRASAGGARAAVNEASLRALSSGHFSLLADRPLQLLWTSTSRLKKHGRQFTEPPSDGGPAVKRQRTGGDSDGAAPAPALEPSPQDRADSQGAGSGAAAALAPRLPAAMFADPSLPLVIDVGCGYGATLLGLCYDQVRGPGRDGSNNFNFLGCDMSGHSISYCAALAHRWGLESNCHFLVCEAYACLAWVLASYPGPVQWVLLQFPTPFAFSVCTDSSESKSPLPVLGHTYVRGMFNEYFCLITLCCAG